MRILTIDEILEGIGVAVAPGSKLSVSVGDTVRITASIEYMGPALSDTFYASIGARGLLGFDEILVGQATISFPATASWTVYTMTVNIPITTAIAAKPDYDIYCKLVNHPEAGAPEVDNVIDVVAAAQFRNFKITDYSKV